MTREHEVAAGTTGSSDTVGRRIAAPQILPEVAPFWAAANAGSLLLKQCADCGRFHHYPRDVCPFCFSLDTRWRASSGLGVIYSYSTMGEGAAAYTLAYVDLDEGVSMLTNLVDCDPAGLRVGARVRVVFKASDSGQALPMFTPVESGDPSGDPA